MLDSLKKYPIFRNMYHSLEIHYTVGQLEIDLFTGLEKLNGVEPVLTLEQQLIKKAITSSILVPATIVKSRETAMAPEDKKKTLDVLSGLDI